LWPTSSTGSELDNPFGAAIRISGMTTSARLTAPRGRTTRPGVGWRLMCGLVGLAALLAAGCGSSSGTSNSSAGDAGTTTTVAATPTTGAGGAAAAGATVAVASDPKLGSLLVGPNGHTLYLFEKDQGTTTACTGGCASAWPALKATGSPTAGSGVTASLLSVSNGQVVYNGHLLYEFSGDQAAGTTNGVGIPSWFAVNPSGDKIAAS
jgi:predicted lipoprotein with Yx(FWY)xxD motif